MEESFNQEHLVDHKGIISSTAREALLGAAKWAKFIGIFFLVLGAVYAIFGLYSIAIAIDMGIGGGAVGFVSLIIVCTLYYLMFSFSYKFGAKVEKGLQSNDPTKFEVGCKNLRNLFTYQGILIIVSVVFVLLFFAFTDFDELTRWR